MTRPAFIIAAARTPVVPSGGAFRDLDYERIAVAPIHACLTRSGLDPDEIDEIVVSNALGAGGNPARVVALAAGLPQRIAGLSLDRQCAGGLDAVILAGALVASGQAEIVLAGGSESHSLRPERRFKADWHSTAKFRDQARFTPWADRDPDMASAADWLARKNGISFDRQNEWAVESHARARASAGRLAAEIVNPHGVDLTGDPFTRNLTPALCQRAPRITGTISAANTSVAADAAAFVAVVSQRVLQRLEPGFALRLVGGKTLGGDPELPGLAPVEAARKLLEVTGTRPETLSSIELMEAYAVQAIACAAALGLDPEKTNPAGGSLARGHPIGASGAILAVRLFHDLEESGGLGLALIAAAGGIGTALLLESVSS